MHILLITLTLYLIINNHLIKKEHKLTQNTIHMGYPDIAFIVTRIYEKYNVQGYTLIEKKRNNYYEIT